ncbi:hypothetical protein B0H10DRAFT_2129498 [Mycena sp. CBHHK59/15]|nr:hypothetical protein B0H10DRAFT_2138912 [Mycena sp. CBHHK59/15]KAJ6548264.1 hypothetical protein B0H10DRAFT_2129498 [Mycena sp. CBHHK59/15]
MPVQLPPFNNIVNLPTAPQDLPDDHDVRAAHEYVKSTDIAWGNSRLGDESHVAAAVAYEHSVLAAYCGGAAAPPWFADALREGLKDIKRDIQGIQEDIDTIKGDVRTLMNRTLKSQLLAAKAHNLQCGDGTARNFETLPFRDGKEPSAQDLPALDTLNDILQLSPEQSKLYYKGYKAGVVPAHAARIATIRKIIGCSVV